MELKSVSRLKSTMVHEYAHLGLDRFYHTDFGWVGPKLEGLNGYYNELSNAGNMHISPFFAKNGSNILSQYYNYGTLRMLPKRFNTKVSLKPFGL